MSKKENRIDTKQAAFDFDRPLQEYENLRVKLTAAPEKTHQCESFAEGCIEIAATVKSALRASGMSREEMVDAINAYFGVDRKGKRLSIHMFNNHLSKPAGYPLPAVYIFAIQHITGSLETIEALAKSEQARVISGGRGA